ncbi:hypothetical protein U9M48_025751 [Paspalum notatum var. saurae]|uniref:AMP-activated protein kinase glycogen-binding domain-containing protein n=1 Tax=Paspalum notatum var. saurae TaxID=547442 RepID=A0AAQ3TT87_PASNO
MLEPNAVYMYALAAPRTKSTRRKPKATADSQKLVAASTQAETAAPTATTSSSSSPSRSPSPRLASRARPAQLNPPSRAASGTWLQLQAAPSRPPLAYLGSIMECLTASFARNVGKEYNFVCSTKLGSENQWVSRRICCYVPSSTTSSQRHKFTTTAYPISPNTGRRSRWRSFAASLNLEDGPAPSDSTSSSPEQATEVDRTTDGDASEDLLSRKLGPNELKSLLADSERNKLLRRLSEANQYNRFLKRQLQIKDDAVVKFKSELAVLELELQALVGLATEIANFDVPLGSRKINGKYIQSHLLSRLEAIHDKVMEQIKDVDSLKPQEISVYWVGMAENVQIMGSFDGWSQGETMSMEYSGDYGRFSATLKLRPGRYEIKFLVDGEWRLSPEYPVAGEGLTQNNILIVE